MILASHIIVSGILGSRIQNYFLAAIIGLVSHYILDAIPHWDYLPEFETEARTKNNFIRTKKFWENISKVALDILFGFGALLIFVIFNQNTDIIPLIISAIFSILPDAVQLLYWMTEWKIIKWNTKLQEFAHSLAHKKINPGIKSGIIAQIATIGIVFLIMYRF